MKKKYSLGDLTYSDMKKNETFKGKSINHILRKRIDFFKNKYTFSSLNFHQNSMIVIIIMLFMFYYIEHKVGENFSAIGWMFIYFILMLFCVISLFLVEFIYKVLYSKKVFYCPYCGAANHGVLYCKRCSRAIDIKGYKYKQIILRCPKCFELNKSNEKIEKCHDCGYKFYQPRKKSR